MWHTTSTIGSRGWSIRIGTRVVQYQSYPSTLWQLSKILRPIVSNAALRSSNRSKWQRQRDGIEPIFFTLCVIYSIPAHLLQYGIGIGPEWIVWQEQQQCRTFSQLFFQEAGLCSGRLQPLKDGLVVFKHPATDGLWCEVTFPSRKNLTEKTKRQQNAGGVP